MANDTQQIQVWSRVSFHFMIHRKLTLCSAGSLIYVMLVNHGIGRSSKETSRRWYNKEYQRLLIKHFNTDNNRSIWIGLDLFNFKLRKTILSQLMPKIRCNAIKVSNCVITTLTLKSWIAKLSNSIRFLLEQGISSTSLLLYGTCWSIIEVLS